MDLRFVPPPSPLNYVEWKVKMVSYLESHDLFGVSIGVLEMLESDDESSISFNDCDRAYGAMCLSIPPRMCYHIDTVEFPSEIWSKLDITFGHHNEYISTNNWESASKIYLQDPPSSITSHEHEVVQDEEMTESSTHSV